MDVSKQDKQISVLPWTQPQNDLAAKTDGTPFKVCLCICVNLLCAKHASLGERGFGTGFALLILLRLSSRQMQPIW